MIPARERIEIDWNTANRLTEENKDFLDYIKLIRQFYQTGENHRLQLAGNGIAEISQAGIRVPISDTSRHRLVRTGQLPSP